MRVSIIRTREERAIAKGLGYVRAFIILAQSEK